MPWLPSFWCRTCGPFTLNLEQRPGGRWRFDLCADNMVIHTILSESETMTMTEAKGWATAHAQTIFAGWIQLAKAIEAGPSCGNGFA